LWEDREGRIKVTGARFKKGLLFWRKEAKDFCSLARYVWRGTLQKTKVFVTAQVSSPFGGEG
jgi:hypothetical protein